MIGVIEEGNVKLSGSKRIVFFDKSGQCPTCGAMEEVRSHWGDCWHCWHEENNHPFSSDAFHELVIHKGGQEWKDYVWASKIGCLEVVGGRRVTRFDVLRAVRRKRGYFPLAATREFIVPPLFWDCNRLGGKRGSSHQHWRG